MASWGNMPLFILSAAPCDTPLKEVENKGGREKGERNSYFIQSGGGRTAINAQHDSSFTASEEVLWFESLILILSD